MAPLRRGIILTKAFYYGKELFQQGDELQGIIKNEINDSKDSRRTFKNRMSDETSCQGIISHQRVGLSSVRSIQNHGVSTSKFLQNTSRRSD